MQQTNIIGDTCKERSIDYDLIDKINKEYETEARKDELKRRLDKKKKVKEEQNPVTKIKDIKTHDELRDIKGNYSLQRGVYVIDFDIHVPNGCGLILEPGVEFYFTKEAGIICEGRFEAKGKSGLEVLLTAKNKAQGWKNLYLKGGAEVILDYARFSYGKGRKDKEKEIIGGALLLESKDGLKPNIIINNSCFENNSAKLGGGIYISHGNVKINHNNIFENNSAGYNGGGIYNWKGDVTIIEENTFENNSAIFGGGAMYNHRGDVRIKEKNIFEHNNSTGLGGAIRNYKGRLDINKLQNIFKNNKPSDIYEI